MVDSTTKRRRPRARTAILLCLGLVVLGGVGWYYFDRYIPYWHFRTVQEGAFYRSSQLNPEDLKEAIDDYGLKTIFNLRDVRERSVGDWYETQKRVTREKGIQHVDVPLVAGTPPNEEQVALMLRIMDDPQNRPVLAHCYHGTIRSAAAEGLFRREYLGESGEEAFAHVESWGRDLLADYPLIAKFILEYVPRRDR